MKKPFNPRSVITALCLSVLSVFTPFAQAAPPDLTAAGAIAALKSDPNAKPVYGETYNLGATGLRGWIYIGGGNGADGTITVESRQILVTVASAPGNAVLAVDDVILGAMAASSGTVPNFTSDARKAFGAAIGDAEKTGAGTLRVKRWRAGTTTDVNIAMTIMGNYSATAPYTCPKSSLILANARKKMVSQLLADPNYLTTGYAYARAIDGLALLAGVAPGDANYATVQTRLQAYARALAPPTLTLTGCDTWNWGYIGIFLSEYYLRTVADGTPDTSVLDGINKYTVALAKAQSRYGTYGHGGSLLKADGSLHGTIPPYGPVNMAGIPANLAIVVGKKALVAASQAIDPEIDPAIQRGSDFFAWYVNKGSIPYGEHEPGVGNHGSNGKDPLCAVLFGLQANRAVETEYFARMSVAGCTGREYGHTGQGFSYLWGAMGANMGGSLAVAEHLKPVRWHLDLSRRTDGSFVYDGGEQYGGGSTADGTYLGACGYNDMNPTASYILTYSLPLKRLYITGKSANSANTLDAAKVTNAIAAATFNLDCTGFTTTQLIAALSEFDPTVRHYAAIELAKRSPTAGELTTLRNMVSGTDANGRMGACQALGLLQDATALPLITQRLDKNVETNSWVRAKAGSAIRSYPSATASAYRDTMLAAYTANATDPEVIVWDDPIQISNNFLSFALFGGGDGNNISSYTITAPKNLLYPAVKAGLKQPDSYSRSGASQFCYDRLTLPDVQALALDIFEVITTKSQADTMWSVSPQLSGIALLKKHNCAEGLPMALSMMDVREGWGHGAAGYLSQVLDNLATWGDSARWIIPFLNEDISTLRPVLNIVDYTPTVPKIQSTIATIDNAITSPGPINYLLPLATAQVVATTGAKAITLKGTSPRSAVTFTNVTAPAHGTLTGTAPNLTYTPTGGYTGPDHFTFQAVDNLTTSDPGTVSIIVGTAGTGLKGEYYDNANFTNLKLTRTDAQVNFDWGTGSPNAALGADSFSVRWSGLLLVPETGTYRFSTLNSDGVRLYINGQLVFDDYVDQTTNWKDGPPVNLTAGQMVDLHLVYYENTGPAVAKLKWTGPSFAGANGTIIGTEWLYDGTGMTLTPYAHAQSVRLVGTTPKPITLTGSGGTLTYAVVTPPAHGTLTGTAPNLIYHPGASYNGTDSFTFLVNNGTSDSNPATVVLADGQLINVNFTGSTAETQSVLSGPAGGLGTTWNQFMGPDSPGTLVDSIGGATTVTITSDFGLPGTFDAPVIALPMLRGSMTNFGKGVDNTNVTISGLEAGGFYDISMVTLRNQPFGSNGTEQYVGWWSTTNTTTSPSNQLVNAVGATVNTSTFVNGYNYVLFQNVAANGSGNIVFTGVAGDQLNGSDDNHRLGLNGLQIKRTDAPSTVESSPATVFADGVLTSTVTVTLRDANGNGIPDKVVTLANTGGPQAATIVPLAAITTNGAGQAVFNVRSTTPGIEIFTATNVTDTLTLTDTASVEFVEVGVLTDAARSSVVASPTARLADGLSTSTITVTLRDTNGYPVSGNNVTLANSGGAKAATISPLGAVTSNANGQAVFSVSSGTIASEEFTATDTTDSIGVTQIATVSFIDPNAPKLINVNFTGGTAETASALSGPGGGLGMTWNQFMGPDSPGTLVYSTGVATTVTIDTNFDLPGTFDSPVIALPMLRGSMTNFGKGVDNTNVTISGLQAGGLYDIWLVTLRNQGYGSNGTEQYVGWWSTTNGTTSPSNQLVNAVSPTINTSTFVAGNNYALFQNVAANGSGKIVFAGVAGPLLDGSNNNHRLGLNGLQIQEAAPVIAGPVISTLNPADNATGVAVGTNLVATFSENIAIGTGNITVKNLTDATQTAIAVTDSTQVSISGAVLTINPTANFAGGKDYAIQIAATAIKDLANNAFAGISNDTTWNFATAASDTTAPTITTYSPADNATGVAVLANLVATFSESVTIGTGNITLKNLSDGTQTTILVTDTTQVSISGAVLTINPTADLLSGKNYAVQIAATAIRDLANNSFAGISDDTNWNFATVDTTPPVISSFSPADEATGVAVGANFVATFSENIVRGTGNITVRNVSDSTSITIAVTNTTQIMISGNVLTINPTADLLPGKNYAIRIAATCIDDTAGYSFAGFTNNTTWNFSTATPDTTPPTITNFSPADNATGVAVGANLVATFSENIAIGTGNITLKNLTDATQTAIAVTDAAQVSISGAVLTINPAADLPPGKNYAIQVPTTAVKDLANNFFAGITNDTAWNFATEFADGPLDAMSVNFYVVGGSIPADFTLEAGETAGLATSNVSGWQNYEVPWGMDSPATPFTLTSTLGAAATLTLNDVRNGGTDDDQPNPNFGGSGDLMDSLAHGTEDPYDESAKFDMTVSNIPYPVYDLIVYLGANAAHGGDGTGKLILNGGAVQNFKVSSGPFAGFVEITNATTPGNYVVFRKLRTSSLTLKLWGNGFNHIGPCGFQIVKDTSGVLPPGPASNPNPQDATVGHASNTDLTWTAGIDAVSRNVYFGTNPSPGASELRGNQTATTFDPGTLANGTYYWRIDEVNADGTTTGPVWNFAVGPPAKAFRPMPWNGMKAVATHVGALKWVAGESAIASSHDVYFGTDSTPDSTEFMGNQSGTTFNPGPLTPATTYYWRVDQVNAQGTMTGDVWSFTTPNNSANKVKVFILAGQSNMVGQGEMGPIGTQGTLAYIHNNDPATYAHLKNGSNWAVRDDAWIWYNRDGTLVKGGLSTGYGADGNNIGPELQFGHAMGINYGQKVLLIKAAWGGKSLQTDFRPPSAGWDFDVPGKAGDKGYYFTEMLKDVIDATANLQTHFPDYNPADGFEFSGFAWHQGWNDLVSPSASAEYEANMEKFIKDLRLAVGVPNLPFVIATTGQSDPVTYSQVELAQLQMENFTKYPAFNGNVSVVDAKSFWFPVSASPVDEGYHWNRNAKSYYMIGDALAGEMLGLRPDTTAPTPDPMSFATLPAALGQTSITMTATTASDPSGVEYIFECTAGVGHSSAWQDSPVYTDTGLTASTQYSYRGRARDKSAAQTATTWSAAASATTAPDTTAPTPDPMSFATPPAALGQTSITMTATTASDPSGVEYIFECTAGADHSSAWQDSPTYTDTGLTAATQYSYRVRARDKSAAQTATAWSATVSATTANTPYGTWSGGAAFDGDANNDGVGDGMAWMLGAASPSENALGKLPAATRNGSNLRLTFRCLKSTERGGVVLKVQTSSDLGLAAPWTNHEAVVPDADGTVNGVVFDTTDDGNYIHVIADIPAPGSGLFTRLSAVNAP